MNDDLILLMDSEDDIVLIDDSCGDIILEDANPYSQQYEIYDGETVFTPTRETQVVFTGNKVLLDDITINPIPPNYGLVTYNGRIITIT